MERYDLYRNIAELTQGDIYIGVVGPVRTGKSTFIKKFMDALVLPNIADGYNRERIVDEMPQSGAGKMIMTTQPRFVPNEAVGIRLMEGAEVSVRMVDCVGYMVKGAAGHLEDDMPRMVRTPWHNEDIPFEQAAEIGTRKVITDHSTIGIVVTTDGSICDIPRSSYLEAEERVIDELKELNKPFVIILNSATPEEKESIKLRETLQQRYEIPVLLIDVMSLSVDEIQNILESVLYEFPVKCINFSIPQWLNALPEDHSLINEMLGEIREHMDPVVKMKDYQLLLECFEEQESILPPKLEALHFGKGEINYTIPLDGELFYKMLGEQCGCEIRDDRHLFTTMRELVSAKSEYSRVADALDSVRRLGYGIVQPDMKELALQEPEIIRQGNRFGVKLKASAPSLHLVKVDIETAVSPIVGSERESEELVQYMMREFEQKPQAIWETDIFGKSLHELVCEGLSNKLHRMPEDVQGKMQETLQKIVNEGSGGLVCILL
jgi:stage IV sporulation protein A